MRLTNSYFNQFTSVSPVGSKTSELKQNQSINSAFYEDRLKDSISTRLQSQYMKSAESLHIVKLESKALQLKNKIDSQKYQIETLQNQTKTYRKLCENQKQQIRQNGIEMLKQQFQQQIHQLTNQKQKLANLIASLNQEYRQIEVQNQTTLNLMKIQNNKLGEEIDQILSIKENILKQMSEIQQKTKQNEQILQEQQERLYELRNIQRKLKIALKQTQRNEK